MANRPFTNSGMEIGKVCLNRPCLIGELRYHQKNLPLGRG